MAESDKTLKKEDNFSNENRKSSVPNIVPITSGSIHNDKSTVPNTAVSEPSTLKRKQTSFQITSVTVKKGSRLSTDGGEDSADDLDESHTEDASSDILDCSRTTDDQFSEDNCNTTHNDDTSTQAPSIPLESKKHLSIKKIAQDNAVFPSETSQVDKLDITPDSSQDVKPPTLPDQWQHRFRVVKIVSSVPFKRGRWLCMDFMDPPVPAVEAKPESIDVSIGSSILPGESIPDRVAHVYEIPPGDAYPGTLSMAVRPDERLQPMYGIFWPISNGQYPFMTGINSKSIASPLHAETKTHESNPSMTPAQGIQHQQNIPPSQTSVSPQVVQQQNLNIPNAISSQAGQHQQNISSTQSAISTTGFQHQQNISSTQSVSSQGIQHQQNVPNTQPVVSSQGIQHQQSLSVVQPPVSNLGIIQPVSSSQPPITSQGMQQTISNTQSTVSTQCNQQTSSTQSSISTQGVQQVFNNAQTVISNQGIPSSNIQSITPGIQQTVSGTQSVVSNQGVQPNTTGLQSSNSVLGIQPNLSVSQAPINQGGQLQNMGNIPAVSSQGIQKQNVNVIHTAVSSQQLQHQNVSGVPPIVTQGILQPSTVSGVQSVSNQGIQQQSMPNTQAKLVEHPKLTTGQTNTGVQNIPNQIQDMSSQSIILGHSSSPPQSQSSVQVIQNVAGQQQAVTSESIPHVKPVSILQAQESQPSIQPHMQILGSSQSQAMSATPTMQVNVETVTQPIVSSSVQDDISQVALTQEPAVQSSVQLTSTVPASTMGNHALATATTPDVMLVSNSKPQEIVVPSQIIQNHVEAKELGTPPSTNVQVTQDVSQETQSVKGDVNGEETESVPSGTSTVAIDNKIEQAMDLVKSHLMFAVREEVDVLKEKITELMDRISQLEYENGFLRANASQQTLEQLNHSQLLQQQQQQNISSTVSLNSVSQISQQPLQSHQLNIQDQQPTS